MPEDFSVGKIGAPWGVKGFVKIHSFSGETAHLKKLKTATLRNGNRTQSISFDAIEQKHGDVVAKFTGIDDRDEAKAFSGWELWVPKKLAAKRKRGEYYIGDLVGCKMLFGEETIGSVTGVSDIGYVDLFEVSKISEGKSFIPFQDTYIGKIDTKARTIELKERWIID